MSKFIVATAAFGALAEKENTTVFIDVSCPSMD
jgi:hypothetical protein